MQVAISIQHASKHYGRVAALDDVSIDVQEGEFLSVLGPSGSGKTTLLHILAGFIKLDSGRVLFGDRDVTLLPPHKRDVGVVFQNYALFPHMTVGENVAFPLKARKSPPAKIAERVAWALDLVKLAGYQGRGISQLSGGQRQRIALARAIVFEPTLILMDEPLSALDKRLRETMQIELRHLHDRLRATTIYVTHDQREALTMSDRIAVLRDGRLLQVDAPRGLCENAVDDFVADFVGESTLVPVTRQGDYSVTLGTAQLRTARPVPEAAKIFLALHAEKLLLASPQRADGFNELHGRVREIVYQGDSMRIFVDLESGPLIGIRQACHHENFARMPAVGATVSVQLHPNDTIVVPEGR
jgi:putative spermidine/putrescine transport system ATP-binding protein